MEAWTESDGGVDREAEKLSSHGHRTKEAGDRDLQCEEKRATYLHCKPSLPSFIILRSEQSPRSNQAHAGKQVHTRTPEIYIYSGGEEGFLPLQASSHLRRRAGTWEEASSIGCPLWAIWYPRSKAVFGIRRNRGMQQSNTATLFTFRYRRSGVLSEWLAGYFGQDRLIRKSCIF